jgi:hypothetical protein
MSNKYSLAYTRGTSEGESPNSKGAEGDNAIVCVRAFGAFLWHLDGWWSDLSG